MTKWGLSWRNHPEEDQLLRYCDGELAARESARLARHLESCWECRARVDEVERTISAYVAYRQAAVRNDLPSPPAPWKNLYPEFARIDVRPEAPFAWLPPMRGRVRWLLGGAAVVCAAVYYGVARSPQIAHPVAEPAPMVVPAKPSAPVLSTPARPHPPETGATADDELHVIAALHEAHADLGDPVEVTRRHDRIVVTGLGLPPARADALKTALEGMPNVELRLSSPALPSAPSGPPRVIAGPPPRPEAFEKFAGQLLETSDAMMARAHALRSLADRFPQPVEAALSDPSRTQLTAIRRQHADALAQQVVDLRKVLGPTVPLGQPRIAPVPPEPWQAHAQRLFEAAREVDRLVGALGGGAFSDADQAALAAALARLEALCASRT